VTVNLDAWNELSKEHQAAIEAAAAALQSVFWGVSKSEDAVKVALLNKNGLKTGDVTAGMLADMQKATKPMTGEFITKVGGASGAIVNGFLKDVGRN
jgi:TRAP-type C4-dicarboxylate transport system substrate-binding protein